MIDRKEISFVLYIPSLVSLGGAAKLPTEGFESTAYNSFVLPLLVSCACIPATWVLIKSIFIIIVDRILPSSIHLMGVGILH